MVTYEALFAFCMMIISLIALLSKKKWPPSVQLSGHSFDLLILG